MFASLLVGGRQKVNKLFEINHKVSSNLWTSYVTKLNFFSPYFFLFHCEICDICKSQNLSAVVKTQTKNQNETQTKQNNPKQTNKIHKHKKLSTCVSTTHNEKQNISGTLEVTVNSNDLTLPPFPSFLEMAYNSEFGANHCLAFLCNFTTLYWMCSQTMYMWFACFWN